MPVDERPFRGFRRLIAEQRPTRREFLSAAAIGAGATLPTLLVGATPASAGDGQMPSVTAATPGPGLGNAVPTTYAHLNCASWDTILSDARHQFTPPVTVHLPIQPVHSPDFIHVDAALNVCRRRVFPKLSTSHPESYRAAQEHETFIVQFALDTPPYMPDFQRSQVRLAADGKHPLAQADYFAWDLYYQFEYFCAALNDKQSILWIVVSVTNEGETPQLAHVRTKVNFQRECDLFDYHYVPFYWDHSKWLPCSKIKLGGTNILYGETIIGKIVPDQWRVGWESLERFSDKEHNRRFGCGNPFFVPPPLRLPEIQDTIHFQTELPAGQRRTFSMALLTNFEEPTAQDQQRLAESTPQQTRAAAVRHFQDQFSPEHTQLVCPIESWDKIFSHLQLSTLQMLVGFPGEKGLMPTQGRSSERHFVWVWEAMFMLLPMLRLGHFPAVRRALEFLFSLQDAGCPPEGRLTTTAGAVGTTGPKWLNATGSALALASDYYLYSRDGEFLREFLPKMIKAMGWIVGEIRATRKLRPDGSRPAYYGIMPFGCATDGDIGYIVSMTDAFTYWGLGKAVVVLERVSHPRSAEFRQELESYRTDLSRAIETMTRPDGYIERKILTGRETITNQLEAISGATWLAYTGCLDVYSDRFQRFADFFEATMMDGFFAGRMTRDVAYMGTGEFAWQHVYLRNGQWKKAFVAMQTNLRYGMTQDTFQVQERFSRRSPAFTPWQPNGSGNGRMLEMMLNALYLEHDGMATLLGGIPFVWLAHNGRTALRNLHTTRGKLAIDAQMLDAQCCRLRVTPSVSGALPRVIRLPEHFFVPKLPAGVTRLSEGRFELAANLPQFELTLERNPHK